MSLATWFWIILIISALLSCYEGYLNRAAFPRNIILFVLLFIIGMALFGSPVQGTR